MNRVVNILWIEICVFGTDYMGVYLTVKLDWEFARASSPVLLLEHRWNSSMCNFF
mgnify:CR=1 FL=1